jgi:hypothetical protein
MAFTPKEAVCQYMGWSYDDANDYRYHYGLTKIPIYSTADGYICATASGKRVPKHDEEYIGGKFVEATGTQADYCKTKGKTVWILKTTE